MKKMKQQNARVFKWKEMLDEYPDKKNVKLKSRARKGMPDAIRGFAWQLLISGSQHLDAAIGGNPVLPLGRNKQAIFKALMEEQGD